MRYKVCERFRGKIPNGTTVNIPYGTTCESKYGYIWHNDKIVAYEESEVAHRYYVRDDDDLGDERHNLIVKIEMALTVMDYGRHTSSRRIIEYEAHNQRRERAIRKILGNLNLMRFRKSEHPDNIVWAHSFYVAEIEDLRHILKIIMEA